MRHVLTTGVISTSRDLPITAEQFDAAKAAWNGLVKLLGIEEKFAFVVENFREFEISMFEQALDGMLYGDRTWSSSVAQLQSLNRRLSNLLSICRQYLDQTAHELSSLFGSESPVYTGYIAATHREYDSALGYRVMEAVRDYVQHRALPIYKLRIEARRASSSAFREWGITPCLMLDRLREDEKFKQSVLDELGNQDEADLKPLVREYVQGLARVQLDVRQATAPHLQTWDSTVSDLFALFEQAHGPREDLPLHVLALHDTDQVVEKIPVLREFTARRRALIERLPGVHLVNSHVSSAVWSQGA